MIKAQMQKIATKIDFQNILMLYVILQPIIDIITSLCVRHISEKFTLGIFIRTIFMLYIMLHTIIKVDKKSKWYILIYYSSIALYSIIFLINHYINYEFSMIFIQLKGLIKVFYFPIILASLLVLYKNKKYSLNLKWLNISLSIYVLTVVIFKIFSIGYPTYPRLNNLGTIGLFYAGNEVSAIIALLAPICFSTFICKKFNIIYAILCALTVFAMLEIGTKVAFVAITALIILSLFVSAISLIRRESNGAYKQFLTILLISILTFLLIGYTSAGKNLNIQSVFSNYNNETSQSDSNKSNSNTSNKKSESNSIALLSGRNIYLKNTYKRYAESPLPTKLIGLGYVELETDSVIESKLVEIDYFDIFFCHGILGTLIYILPLALIILISLKNFFTNFICNIKNYTLIFMIYSILIGFGIALLAGHVFTAPAVSIFLIIVILEMFKILNIEKELKNE